MARPRKQKQITPSPINDLDDFRAWLQDKPADEIVGSALSPYECPFTNWMKSLECGTWQIDRCTRWSVYWTYPGDDRVQSMALPQWAQDLATTLMTYHYGKMVTAGEVLAMIGSGD